MWNGKVIGIDTDNKTGDPLILVNYWDTEGHEEDGEVSLSIFSSLLLTFNVKICGLFDDFVF